jgi:hypothetical protein
MILGKGGVENLKSWVRRGGVLIGIGNATRFLADPNVDLVSIRREDAVSESKPEPPKGPGGGDAPKKATVEGKVLTSDEEYRASITPKKQDPDRVAGVLLNAEVDPDHWLSAGVASRIRVLAQGSDVFTPIRLDKGVNVARFGAAEELLASGHLWEENRKQLAYKPFAVAQPFGAGHVIAFTQDPNYRAYLDGLNMIFMNAIFRGSAHARPVR